MKWTYEEKWWGEVGDCEVEDLKAHVQDCDGDFSTWVVKDGKIVVASGQSWATHHFKIAVMSAEAALKVALKPAAAA